MIDISEYRGIKLKMD